MDKLFCSLLTFGSMLHGTKIVLNCLEGDMMLSARRFSGEKVIKGSRKVKSMSGEGKGGEGEE